MVLKKITGWNAGFTLIELMVVIGILSIMSSIAIPNIISWLPDYRLRSATREIVSCLQDAKLRAVKENSRAVVIFDHMNESYTAFVDNVPAGGNWALDATEIIIRQGTMPAGVDIQSAPFTTSYTFGFNKRGLSDAGANTVQLINNKSNYSRIIVNLPGRIRVQMSSDGINWN